MKDPDFIADASAQHLKLTPQTGAALASLIDQVYATPKQVVQKIGKWMQ
jgi:hypothetical protein